MNTQTRYQRFASQLFEDAKLLAFTALTLQAIRVFLLAYFRLNLAESTTLPELLTALGAGLRYDATIAFYLAAPGLLFTVLSPLLDTSTIAGKVRLVAGSAWAALVPLLTMVCVGYVKEYNDLFNHFLFGLIYDDFDAIALTVWNQQPVVWQLLGAVAAGWAMVWLFHRFMRLGVGLAVGSGHSTARRVAWVLALVALFVFSARGGFGRTPVQYRDRNVSNDEFLNRMVMNPVMAFRYAVKHHLKAFEGGPFKQEPTLAEVKAALKARFPGHPEAAGIDDHLLKRAAHHTGERARHIFLIVMESYDSWPFLPPFKELDLVPEGKRLGNGGYLLGAFTSTASGTMTSMSPLMAGLYNPGLRSNYMESARRPYPTAPGVIFSSLGYRTRLFYGGSLSWQRLGDYAANQGFEERYGMESIQTPTSANEWGVDDGSLFDFALAAVDPEVPSFNLILTTGNHPPYNLDLAALGWKRREVSGEAAELADGRLSDAIMGHLWYSDRAMGAFVDRAAKKLKPALFAVTGDHFSRKFINARPDLYQGTSVPLILYGPEVLEDAALPDPEKTAAAHLDIIPTLVELSAPEGAPYHAVGESLLDPERSNIALGPNIIYTPDFVISSLDNGKMLPMPRFDGTPSDAAPPSEAQVSGYKELRRELDLISWWRIVKGDELDDGGAAAHAR